MYNTVEAPLGKEMTKTRILLFAITVVIVSIFGIVASYYARGYRFDRKTFKFSPNGLLVINSEPNGAQVVINGDLKTATNSTISLVPGTYDITLKKESFIPWQKRMVIEKEVVTAIDAVLFPAAPSLTSLTFSGATDPTPSKDSSKIAFIVPVSKNESSDKGGIWIVESINLPIGFIREPKRVADGDFAGYAIEWSYDSREILVSQKGVSYLFDISDFTPQNQRVNVSSQVKKIKLEWGEKEKKQLTGKLNKFESTLKDLFATKAKDIIFSPDENKILYIASESASIPQGLVKQLPGASTQKQTRDIKIGKKYIYDIKEDRNFEIADDTQPTYWLPTSNHIIAPQEGKIVIMDYDGTNRQVVYSGSYISPHAYPYSNASKILILTNLGATDSLPNLYSLNLK